MTNREKGNLSTISNRGEKAANTSLRIDFEIYFEAVNNLFDLKSNPDGAFPLNVAENRLCQDIFRDKLQELLSKNEIPEWVFSYTSPMGAPDFRKTVADFLEDFLFKCPVKQEHIGFSAGATSVVELSSFILGEPGDVAAFPAPCYPVYKNDIGGISGMERFDIITHHELVSIHDSPILEINHLEKTKRQLNNEGKRFRMLVLTNPDNPTGAIYPQKKLEEIANWCIANKIHLVVNEIYGLSIINTKHPELKNDYQTEIPFQSFAPIVQAKKSEYLHIWYAFSKDFGISGFRVGLLYSLNEQFLKAYENLNLSHSVSNFTQWSLQLLLQDKEFVLHFIETNQERLTAAYLVVIQSLRKLNLTFVPARGSLFVWVDLSEFLKENTQTVENEFWLEVYHETKILITPSEGFGNTKKGQFRIVYPYLKLEALQVAMEKFENFILTKRNRRGFI